MLKHDHPQPSTSMQQSWHVYNDRSYVICTRKEDASGEGCIREIIQQNEYRLERYADIQSHIIDIGANCGVATVILGKQNPLSTIYAFEPDPNTYELLVENVRLNGLDNVRCHNLAVADARRKTVELYLHPDFSGGNTTCADEKSFREYFTAASRTLTVKCISLDEIIAENAIDSVELLKIDCEGAEYEILYGSTMFRDRIVKNMVGEFHSLRYNTQAENDVESLLAFCKQNVEGFVTMTLLSL